MASNKKIVEEVSNWLRVFDDGTVDRTWTGPPQFQFLMDSVPPHDDFIHGVAIRDVVIDSHSGLTVRIYIPERNRDTDIPVEDKLPLFLHFHGGGFCITAPDYYMYYNFYRRLVTSARADASLFIFGVHRSIRSRLPVMTLTPHSSGFAP